MSSLRIYLSYLAFGIIIITGCGKNETPPTQPPGPTPPTPTPPQAKTCILSGISQLNSGSKPDFALTVSFINETASAVLVFDSLGNQKIFDAAFQQITADSVRIDAYQYIKLDANKRVIAFVTKSDLKDPVNSDNYRYTYNYNSDGFLTTKNLFINGAHFYSTAYTYTNNTLTKCIITIAGNTASKVLESDLAYDANTTVKNWIYTFPDAFESFLYNSALNFGNKSNKTLTQVVTKIFNPTNGTVLDTWTTNYTGYVINTDGYVQSANANGDLQQGMASFYGKTTFYYQCK